MYEMTKDNIQKILEKVTGIKNPEVDFASDSKFGDYSSNICLRNKDLDPQKIANEINGKDLQFSAKVVGKFINFWLKKNILVDNLIQIEEKKGDYGKSEILTGQKYLIEHTSPNPNKALHLGHLRNNVTGMAIANMWEFLGCNVTRDCIDNNRGIAIAKLMWGYLKYANKDGKQDLDINYWFNHQNEWQTSEELGVRPDKFVDDLYVKGSEDFKNSEIEAKVRQLVVDWEAEDKAVWALWEKVLEYSYEGQNLTLKRLGNKWDKVWHEHEHYKKGKEFVQKGLKKGIFKVGEKGAIVTDLSKYNLPDTVVIKSDGTALYITQDLSLTELKKKTFNPDKIFWVIGPEQSLALKQMFAVCEQLGIIKYEDCIHLAYGYMSLKGKVKMSSREGTVIYIDDLLDEAKRKVNNILQSSDFNDQEKEIISEKVGIGAVKYSILKVSRLQDVSFDLKESISLEGNSGPYIQYTVARCNSVVSKGRTLKPEYKVRNPKDLRVPNLEELQEEELAILRKLSQFTEIISIAAKSYSPNILCEYLYSLASKYNTFYNKHKIIKSENETFRILLTKGTGQVLKNGLNLLGISVPEKM
ncbi:MAG: arginyl-tRNA synthetase [Candidatus Woesebacteria bacterium GW2011_GWC2_33_12]|uniref:Arginine--tRNA ligase n=1 Tax=Candidatus Woesebacteria bacterium GW2011_GWB1_33_22 TaxID=1618566 RepID=A0A0F9ZZT5_9BACT|nr:MAG: arginyl-tRNA synthetase [Candidatus Woesebacteria bacterium GW2011_GWC2_33_12]KKP41897.1 MAG: arginyl-tRNA synthetase [Candidatus Woesebacteria bacterium GW2011_GWA2_33_20]KKP44471.1 MAG: arginyl-tRNA synthetase [Candidatus Woesebacteria bacterium GW2011_GWB1_33_22]KKP46321.1 MAG: arginyl-tRNA synthetase [Microgenomates group bacterium GW2011_GWC1_33_28]KKP50418.1 MAG: arginyl-tRNA synthetase [Candidatus Woesebacteria bacterium GW2011_GWA1_33_33]